MTMTSEKVSVVYQGDGSTTVFPLVRDASPIIFDQNADITVQLIEADGQIITQVETTNYTLTGAGSRDVAGEVTMLVAPAADQKLAIFRAQIFTQDLDLIQGGSLDPETLEAVLDSLVQYSGENKDALARTPKLAQGTSTLAPTFPEPEADKAIAWDEDGVDLVNRDAATWITGNGPPPDVLGNNGDMYLDVLTNDVYGPKTGGVWGGIVANIEGDVGPQGEQGEQGEQGVDGRTVLNGVGAPSDALGIDGDFYIDTAVFDIYGPKAGGTWPAPVTLVGPQGPQGDQGEQGPPGADGVIGQDGLDGIDAGFPFVFDNATAMVDPGAGELRFNSGTAAGTTQIAISDTAGGTGNADVGAYLTSLGQGTGNIKSQLLIRRRDAQENYAVFNVTAASDNGVFHVLDVTFVDSDGAFVNGADLSFASVPAGDEGPAGPGGGDVIGPGSATPNALVRFDGGTGTTVKNSGIIVDDDNAMTGVGRFSSISIDANSTQEVAQFNNNTIAFTTSSGAFTLRNITTDVFLAITGSNNAAFGGNLRLFGDNAGAQSNDIEFRSNGDIRARWDESELRWDFFGTELFQMSNLIRGIADGTMFISGGSATGAGGNIVLRGESQVGEANDILFRSGTVIRAQWDNSNLRWDFFGNELRSVSAIQRGLTNGSLFLGGDQASTQGANIILFGSDASLGDNQNKIEFRQGAADKLVWDANVGAAGQWDFQNQPVTGVNTFVLRNNNAIRAEINDSDLTISGGNGKSVGANHVMYGSAEANQANDHEFRTGATVRLRWDNSILLWDYLGHGLSGVPRIFMSDGPSIRAGTGSPEGAQFGAVGSIFMRFDGDEGTAFYVKRSQGGTVNGWGAVDGEIAGQNVIAGGTHTLLLSDAGKLIRMTSAAVNTVTVPNNATTAFPVNTEIAIAQYGTGQTSIAPAAGVTLNSEGGNRNIRAQFTAASLIKVATDEWLLVGALVA